MIVSVEETEMTHFLARGNCFMRSVIKEKRNITREDKGVKFT